MFETVPIDAIEVGERRREEMGDLAALAASIKRYGLIHPIVVDEANKLVAGGRRLASCKTLGWTEIPVRRYADLQGTEREEIELEENQQRKDLTEFEISRKIVRDAERIAPVISGKLPEKDSRGRKSHYAAPREAVAEALGTSERELVRAEQHVATAEEFPFMQKPDWKQYHVLEAREHLEKIPEPDRPVIAAMVGEVGVPPQAALKMISNVAAMPEAERLQVVTAYQKEDRRDQEWAKTKAADLQPYIDERQVVLIRILRDLRECGRMYPGDPFNEPFTHLISVVTTLKADIEKAQKERNNENAGARS